MTLGNGTTETFTLNDRLQMTGQELKRGSDVLQKYDYGFGELDSQGVLKNNGKLESVVSHIGTAKQWTQKFSYDSIGRLKQSEERRGDTNALTYKQNFDFDRFGNMYRKAANNNPTGQENPLPYTPIEDADIGKSTNRFTTETTYDDAGNVITDNKFREMSFGYDANGRMVKANKPAVPDARTVYDAFGNRVATKISDVWQYTIYDAFGKLVAEYGTDSQTDGIKYVQQDWQGSVRTTTTNSGFVSSRTDHQAFGEEIGAGTGLRTAQQGYGISTPSRQGYGMTEKDDATGLNHTWFRKNENQAGRFTSPDPYNGSMSLNDPQSFNRYSYVENDPVNWVDPSGLFLAGPNTRYGSLHPMGVAYYVDGILTDASHAWAILGMEAGYIDFTNIGGIAIHNEWTGERTWRQNIHVFGTGIGSPVEGGDCIPGIPCVKKMRDEARQRQREKDNCIRTADGKGKAAFNANAAKYPYDDQVLAQKAMLRAGVGAAGAGAVAPKGRKGLAAAVAAAAAFTIVYGERAIDRENGAAPIYQQWLKDLADCGVTIAPGWMGTPFAHPNF